MPLPWLKDASLYTVLLQVIPVFRDIKNLSLYLNKAVITEDAWSVPSLEPPPRRTKPPVNMYSKEIMNGRWDVSDAEGKLLRAFAEKYNIDLKKFK